MVARAEEAEGRRRLEVELAQARATVSAADEVPGQTDAELRGLEERVKREQKRRERDAMREVMRAGVDQELVAMRAERLCEICINQRRQGHVVRLWAPSLCRGSRHLPHLPPARHAAHQNLLTRSPFKCREPNL